MTQHIVTVGTKGEVALRPFVALPVLALLLGLLVLPAAAQDAHAMETPAEEEIPEGVTAEGERPATTEAVGNPYERAVHLAEPSIVYLDIEVVAYVADEKGWLNEGHPFVLNSHCSGSVISPDGFILTASHCVDGRDFRWDIIAQAVDNFIEMEYHLDADGNSMYESWEELFNIAYDNWKVEGTDPGSEPTVSVDAMLATSVAGLSNGRVMGARIVDTVSLSDGDVALLKVEQSGLPALPLAGSDPNVGADIISIGYPGAVDQIADADLNAAYKDGRISQVRTRDGGRVPMFELSAAMGKGMSGGPTVNMDGEIVGVNSLGIEDEGGDSFNFVAPVSLVREVTGRNSVGAELDETSQAWRDGVTAFHAQDYGTAVKQFDAVLAAIPSHAKASELRQVAQREVASAPAPAPEPPNRGDAPPPPPEEPVAAAVTGSGGVDVTLVVAGVVLALLLGMGGMFMVMRRKKKQPAPTVQSWPVPSTNGHGAYDDTARIHEPSPEPVGSSDGR